MVQAQTMQNEKGSVTVRKPLTCCFLLIVFSLSFCGCARSGDSDLRELTLDCMQNEEGIFEFAELPLGMTPEEVAKKTGVSLEAPTATLGSFETYSLGTLYTYQGAEALTQAEFHEGGLSMVSFLLQSEEEDWSEKAGSLYESMASELETLYGAATLSPETENGSMTSVSKRWMVEHDDGKQSTLQLVHIQNGGKTTRLALSVGQWIAEDE